MCACAVGGGGGCFHVSIMHPQMSVSVSLPTFSRTFSPATVSVICYQNTSVFFQSQLCEMSIVSLVRLKRHCVARFFYFFWSTGAIYCRNGFAKFIILRVTVTIMAIRHMNAQCTVHTQSTIYTTVFHLILSICCRVTLTKWTQNSRKFERKKNTRSDVSLFMKGPGKMFEQKWGRKSRDTVPWRNVLI